MAQFHKILRLLRNERNMSQQDLADVLKISKSAINMYERGERQPNFETLEIIADFFNVDIDFLLGRTDKTTKVIMPSTLAGHFDGIRPDIIIYNGDTQLILEMYQNLNSVGQKRALHYLKEISQLYRKQTDDLPNAAHTRTDIEVTSEDKQHDNDIMDDEDF